MNTPNKSTNQEDIMGIDSIKTNKSNLHLNTLESMNYENNEAIIPSF